MQTETTSNFPHTSTNSLGIYKNSIFATGDYSTTYGLKTEKLEIGSSTWFQLDNYPSMDPRQDRFVN